MLAKNPPPLDFERIPCQAAPLVRNHGLAATAPQCCTKSMRARSHQGRLWCVTAPIVVPREFVTGRATCGNLRHLFNRGANDAIFFAGRARSGYRDWAGFRRLGGS